MPKPKSPAVQEYIEDPTTGRRWPLVKKKIGDKEVHGFWSGEPEKSAFLVTDAVADKRGITKDMGDRLRAENDARKAISAALSNPVITRDNPPLVPPASPFEYGTLDWYRNELALAQDRIRLLESEVAHLLRGKREWDPVLVWLVEQPKEAGRSNTGPRASRYAKEHAGWQRAATAELREHPNRSESKMVTRIRERTETKASRKVVRDWWRSHECAIRAKVRDPNKWV